VVALWGIALGVAWVGVAIVYRAQMGINWGIWVTLVAAGLVWSATRGGRRVDPIAARAVGLAVFVSWAAVVTDSWMFQGFIILTCLLLLTTASRIVGGVRGPRIGLAQMIGAPAVACVSSIFETGRRGTEGVGCAWGSRSMPVIRGFALAGPVALVFAATLAGADPMLTQWRDAIGDWVVALHVGPTMLVFIGLTILALGSYGLALRVSESDGGQLAFDAPPSWRIGQTERAIVIATVTVVFGLFLAVQPSYLFRNTDTLRVSGMSFTDYAHRGFTELTIAATLCAVLLLTLDRHTRREPNPDRVAWASRWGYWCPLLLIAEVLVVLASAFYRVSVYETTFGYTTLRVYVQAYVVGMAIALLLMANEVAGFEGEFDGRRVARRAAVVAVLFLAAFSYGNPEQWVVRRTLERYRATGKVDVSYLATMSLNAAPAVVTSMAALPSQCVESIRHSYRDLYDTAHHNGLRTDERWFEWNFRRRRGLAAVRALLAAADGSGVQPSEHCDRSGADVR
jgi:hypothetical protein